MSPDSGDTLLVLCSALLIASLVLGGGTRPGFLSDAVLQFSAIPVLLVSLWQYGRAKIAPGSARAWLFTTCLCAVPLAQLIPLPPVLLPERDTVLAVLKLRQLPLPWMPVSLTPNATWIAALSLLPPVALFLGTTLLYAPQRRTLNLVLLAGAASAVLLGLLQVAEGPASPLRPFETTNLSEAVGFFANRNHFAALLYSGVVYLGAWMCDTVIAPASTRAERASRFIKLMFGFTLVVAFVGAQAMTRSRAGVALTMVALAGSYVLAASVGRSSKASAFNRLQAVAVATALMFAAQFALLRVLERFTSDPLADARIVFARNTYAAALKYMPFGSGIGSFPTVYAYLEAPVDALVDTFANHAHNDVLEAWLESGATGIGLAFVFAFWFVQRGIAIWRMTPSASMNDLDILLARASSILIGLLAAHSLVDYPIHTEAMMVITALACGLMTPPASERTAKSFDQASSVAVFAPSMRNAISDVAMQKSNPAMRQFDGVRMSIGRKLGGQINSNRNLTNRHKVAQNHHQVWTANAG